MKKILLIAATVPAALLLLYAAVARFMTAGLRAYLVGTQAGGVLASTWLFALIGGLVLLIPFLLFLRGKAAALLGAKLGRDKGFTQPFGNTTAVSAGTGTVPPASPAAPGGGQLYEPASPAAPGGGQLYEPASPAQAGADTVVPAAAPAGGETVLLDASAAPEEGGKFCNSCGNRVDGKKFCTKCGAPVS